MHKIYFINAIYHVYLLKLLIMEYKSIHVELIHNL